MGRKSLQQERRTQILDVCERIVVREGLPAMTPLRVARELGLSRSTIHHYFRTQADLAAGLVTRMIDGYLARVARVGDAPPSAFEIRSALEELMGERFLVPRFDRLLMEIAAASHHDKRIRRELHRFYGEIEARCIASLEKAFPSVDPDQVREGALAVNALIEGAYQLQSHGRPVIPDRRMARV
jgi:AcrR family transcriptional regulator